MTRTIFAILFIAFLVLQLPFGCISNPPKPPTQAIYLKTSFVNCRPNTFPYQGGWLGGDVAYSIPLENDSTLWLFGDTYIGAKAAKSRTGSIMIGNSIAISQCDDKGRGTLRYDWRTSGDSPRAVFEPVEEKSRFWPQDGFEHENALYITLLEVRDNGEGGALGFDAVRTVMAKVTNYLSPADRWNITLTPLVEGKILAGVSIVKQEGYAYLFTWVDTPAPVYASPAILARIPLTGLDKPSDNLEYLASDGKWKAGLDTKDAKAIFERGMTEMSVRYHPSKKLWVAFMHEPKWPSRHIVVQTSPSMTGPWSKPRVVYTVPEMTPENTLFDPETFCYATKEQAQFDNDEVLTVTYACNSFSSSKQMNNMTIYSPQVVNIPWSTVLVGAL